MSDEKHYIERGIDGSYRVMSGEEKAERDMMMPAAIVMIIGWIVILVNMGFTPWSFFSLIGWTLACIVLHKLIAILVGLAIVYFVGSFIIKLFFF